MHEPSSSPAPSGPAGGPLSARTKRTAVIVAAVALAVWGAFDVLPRGRTDPKRPSVHRTDFTVYTTAGAAFFDGGRPYDVVNPRGWHYLYPPLFALIVAPLARLDSVAQVAIGFVVSALMLFGCYRECDRLGERFGGWPAWVVGAAALTVVGPIVSCLQRGQLGVLLLYFLLLGFRLVATSGGGVGWFVGGVVLALPGVLKVVPTLPVLMLLLGGCAASLARRAERPRWALATAGVGVGGLLFVAVVPSALIGWEANAGHLRTWYERVAANGEVARDTGFDFHSERNQSLLNAAHLLRTQLDGTSRQLTRRELAERSTAAAHRVRPWPLFWARAAFVVLTALVSVRLAREGGTLALLGGFGLAGGATLVVSPLAWGHYFMVLLPALLAIPTWLARRGRPVWGKTLAWAPVAVSVPSFASPELFGRFGLLGLGTALWLAAAGALVLTVPRANPHRSVPAPHVFSRVARSRRDAHA